VSHTAIPSWLTWAAGALAVAAAAIFCTALLLWMGTPSTNVEATHALPPVSMPQNAFTQPQNAYDAIGAPVLTLLFSPMTTQLPDLRRTLNYHGKNGRPDVPVGQAQLHFSTSGHISTASILPGENLYLLYDRASSPPQYIFSPHNGPTSLWITAHAEGSQATIDVWAYNDRGERLQMPVANVQIVLPERDQGRSAATAPWELDGMRADGTLFVRQKARWFGYDRFLEQHGGEEYDQLVGKQRLDFGEGDSSYSVYLGPGDVLIWKGKRWHAVIPGVASRGYPLIAVKKMDERLMTMELWDPEGKSKITLNLLKSGEAWNSQAILQSFIYVGARTRHHFVFEVNGERLLLTPHDWLLNNAEGWKKLTTPEQIDSYVNRKLLGILFVFQGVERREGKLLLFGELYSPARSDMQKVELLVQPGSKPMAMATGREGQKKPAVKASKIFNNDDNGTTRNNSSEEESSSFESQEEGEGE